MYMYMHILMGPDNPAILETAVLGILCSPYWQGKHISCLTPIRLRLIIHVGHIHCIYMHVQYSECSMQLHVHVHVYMYIGAYDKRHSE